MELTDQTRLLYPKAEPVKLLLLDVDGVLTDGSLIYSEDGIESKAFNTQDGLGIRLVQKAEVEVGIITARSSKLVARRASELNITHLMQGVSKKFEAYKELLHKRNLKPYQVCYMGDDWIDLPILTKVGFATCPANSVTEVQEHCHFVTARSGGSGAVREVCDILLKSKGVFKSLLQNYLGSC
ncbi:MAG: hypothetical protein D6B25_09340 [Desulfobulbaceae bacterium]|nr:MAG: hypothetical protein D6B25_09340 [Desulfobulbaceae bacterium]